MTATSRRWPTPKKPSAPSPPARSSSRSASMPPSTIRSRASPSPHQASAASARRSPSSACPPCSCRKAAISPIFSAPISPPCSADLRRRVNRKKPIRWPLNEAIVMSNVHKPAPPNKPTSDLNGLAVTPADITAAAATIHGAVIVTQCSQSRTLSEVCGCNLWLKFENLQFPSTFKERGALNRLGALSADERRRGVIAMSAGNHAQGVAYHAQRLGVPATIVMPIGTPMVKIENTRRHGAKVIISGKTLEEAGAFAREHCEAHDLTMIHPYDDPLIIAGQGTIALEMLDA